MNYIVRCFILPGTELWNRADWDYPMALKPYHHGFLTKSAMKFWVEEHKDQITGVIMYKKIT